MDLFLSRLILNARHPQVRSELDHPYDLHRTLSKAFDHGEEQRILFRAEEARPGEVHVFVQSQTEPNWSKLEAENKYLSAIDPPKPLSLRGLEAGMVLRFRLRCRPSKRIAEAGHPDEGKRKSLKEKDEIFEWLKRKAEENGFEVKDAGFDRIYWHESKEGKDQKPLGAVQFDGVLVVTDPDKLKDAVRNGIGPQKAYGFGLLSLAPIRE